MSDSLWPHESQHARPPCPSPTPGVHSDSHPPSQWCHPAISSSVVPFSSCPQIPPSIRVFSNESTLHLRWPKYWSFSLSISPSNEHPGLISFRMDWLDFLAVQGTLKSLQHHSSKASILRHSAFFTVQLSHPYMTTGNSASTLIYLYLHISHDQVRRINNEKLNAASFTLSGFGSIFQATFNCRQWISEQRTFTSPSLVKYVRNNDS